MFRGPLSGPTDQEAWGINPQDPRRTGGDQLETLRDLWKQRIGLYQGQDGATLRVSSLRCGPLRLGPVPCRKRAIEPKLADADTADAASEPRERAGP
jgi:hypothetical protein